jgi:hypothetical protein
MPTGDIETLHNDGKWHNVVQGTDQVSEPFDTQEEAVAEGRAMAQDLQAQHIVKNLDGSVAERTPIDGSADGPGDVSG